MIIPSFISNLIWLSFSNFVRHVFGKYNLDFAITGGKFISFKDRNYLVQIEIVKKIKEPANLGKVKIDGEWI